MATERSVKVRLTADPGGFIAGFRAAQAAVKDLERDIDKTNDRTAWLAQSFLALGPALGPLSAAAVPALAGLATQLTVAGLAAGTMTLAFNGVGDALKALNDYQIDPTEAHLKKLHETMAFIGPTGRDLVRVLDEVRNNVIGLSNLARDNMFPGVIEAFKELSDLGPQVTQIVAKTAAALGDLATDAGAGLSGRGFEDFFDFLESDGVPTLDAMARTLGNIIEGLGAMLAAFAPLSRDFTGGMLEMSRSFAAWAHGLRDNASFQDFIDYVRENTPRVMDLLGQLAGTFAAIVEAAAPVGEVMIPLLTHVFDLVEALVDTPLGPIFIAAAAAMSLYGRAAALASITTGGLGGKLVKSALGVEGLKAALKGAQAEMVVTNKVASTLGDGLVASSVKAQAGVDVTRAKYQGLTAAMSVATAEAAFSGATMARAYIPANAALTATSAKARILGTDLALIALKDSTPTSVKAQIIFESRLAASDAQAKLLARDLGIVAAEAGGLTYAGKNVQAFGADLSKTDAAAKKSASSVRSVGKAFGPAATSVGIFALALSPLPEKMGLTNAAFGAMIGSLGGPEGAVLGAAAGLAFDLSKAYFEAATATREFKGDTQGLATTLDQQTGAITKNTEAFVKNELATQGVIAAARDIGVSSDMIVDAYLGDELAIYRVNEALLAVNDSFYDSEGRTKVSADTLDDYRGSLELVSSALGAGKGDLDAAREGMLLTGDVVDDTADKFHKVADEVDYFGEALGGLHDKLDDRGKLRAYQGALDDFGRSIRDNGKTLDTNTQKGRDNQAALDGIVGSALEVAETLDGVARKEFLRQAREDIVDAYIKLGYTREEARKLARQFGILDLIKATPTVKVGNLELTQEKVDALERGLLNLSGITATPQIVLGMSREVFGSGPGFAAGGWTGDMPKHQVAGVVHGKEFVVPAPYAERDRAALEKAYLPGYAGGGFVDPSRAISVNVGGSAPLDYDRLAASMLRARPVYGDVTVIGDGQFEKQARQDAALAAKGGG